MLAQPMQRRFGWGAFSELPFLTLSRVLPASLWEEASRISAGRRVFKLRFRPGKVRGQSLGVTAVHKESPPLSSALNRWKLLPRERRNKPQTGIVVEVESGYGLYDTFVGRVQHGTQFKGAHYSMQGHWEKTEGEGANQEEENIAASARVDWDISKTTILALHSSYFQSQIDLPQFVEDSSHHQKSAIEIIADLRVNFDPETDTNFLVSGEQAIFDAGTPGTFEMNRYRSQVVLNQLWSRKNTLRLDVTGAWDELWREGERLDTRYYGTASLINSFAMRDNFAVETGVVFEYYHAEDLPYTGNIIAPIFTTRFRLLPDTTLYTTYHPRLQFPDFVELYIRKIYTTVNPDLHAETVRHYLESGLTQRLGDAVSLNLGLFYQEREDLILQIDDNTDNLLEYIQAGSSRFMGVKTNLQMNFAEQFVQTISYTYTDYDLLSWESEMGVAEAGQRDVLPYFPHHQVQASLYWLTPLGLAIDCSGTYVSEQFRNRRSEHQRIGKRFFVHVTLTQKLTDTVQIFFLGRNLTGTDTYDIIPLLDSEEITSSRLFIAGLRLRL
ncbi:hypothetical protein GF339_06200 [candidate division KSB3 bacterium]|uniref:TonB-dependent receptor-like beta-barrel domain-containing protein n=1 Tax=candidate division KSB3 bacterium TaxID=2044937 RepID=A0A9D5JUC8_9BACT|nr:hypothetical protein [candidate division KSB3 bacterium]MBD3324156.1 hypothetical protein [candidate division KSB3 bacterium]